VLTTPSSSTAYPQPAIIHQPACAAGRKLDRIEPCSADATTDPTIATPRDWPS
jgi:hypothetical protein